MGAAAADLIIGTSTVGFAGAGGGHEKLGFALTLPSLDTCIWGFSFNCTVAVATWGRGLKENIVDSPVSFTKYK